MSDTPRVDEFCKTSGGQYTYDLSGLARHLERELAAAIEQRDEMRLALKDLTDAFADYGGPTYSIVYKNALIALGWTAATGEGETRAMSSAAAIRAMKKECGK